MHTEQLERRICKNQLTNWWVDNLFLPNEMVKTVTLIHWTGCVFTALWRRGAEAQLVQLAFAARKRLNPPWLKAAVPGARWGSAAQGWAQLGVLKPRLDGDAPLGWAWLGPLSWGSSAHVASIFLPGQQVNLRLSIPWRSKKQKTACRNTECFVKSLLPSHLPKQVTWLNAESASREIHSFWWEKRKSQNKGCAYGVGWRLGTINAINHSHHWERWKNGVSQESAL